MPSIAEARPPFITFETMAVEDRAASIAAGHYVAKDVHFVHVTPMGSKDRVTRDASEWLAHMAAEAESGRIPAPWVDSFSTRYKAWVAGQALPESGTPIANWPAASPAQVKMLVSQGFRTLEDLAAANEEALARIGPGTRSLRDLAKHWLESSVSSGAAAAKISALEISNQQLAEANAALSARLDAFMAESKATSPKSRVSQL
jgi:hypothetical protein